MNKDLLNTNWILIESIGWGGWTIYVNANYPSDFLSFQDNWLFNMDFREMACIPQSYSSSDSKIQLEDHTWEIGQLTHKKLTIHYLGKEFHYRKIILPPKEKTSRSEIIDRLVGERWVLRDSLDYSSNVSIFLEEQFDETEIILEGYSILLAVGYNRKMMDFPPSVKMYGWKIIFVEGTCFLSLYDIENSFQNLTLILFNEEEILFQGKQKLRLVKKNDDM